MAYLATAAEGTDRSQVASERVKGTNVLSMPSETARVDSPNSQKCDCGWSCGLSRVFEKAHNSRRHASAGKTCLLNVCAWEVYAIFLPFWRGVWQGECVSSPGKFGYCESAAEDPFLLCVMPLLLLRLGSLPFPHPSELRLRRGVPPCAVHIRAQLCGVELWLLASPVLDRRGSSEW